MILSDEVQTSLIEKARNGEIRSETLKDQRGDCRVSRLFLDDERTLILKMWSRSRLSRAFRRMTRTAPFMNEALAMKVLYEQGVSVPQLLGYLKVRGLFPPYTHALFVEDLGSCTFASEHLKVLIAEGRQEEGRAVVSEVLDITEKMVMARIIDRDHSFNNVVVTSSGRVARIDLECARRYRFPEMHPALYGEMLGRLVGTYVFANQPEVTPAMRFARELADRIRPSRRVLLRAEDFVSWMLSDQKRERGLDVRIPSLWTGRPIP
jgi:hypothetical protein